MNSNIRMLIGILVIGIVLVSGCFLSSWRSGEPEETPAVSGMVNGSQLSIKTDKEVYGVGEEIIITITNNLSRPIRYVDVCSLRPCHYLEDGWFCEMTDCHGAIMVIEPGSSEEMHDRTRSLVETRLRYEFEYQIVPEDTLYTARSNEFTIRNNVNAVPTSVSKPSPSSVKTETVVSHPNQTEWTNSDDGLLSLRLSSDKGEYVSGEIIEVKIELKNNSRSTVRVAALVYALGTYGNALSVTGPGQIEYHGPYKEFYAPPIEISPGEIRQETTVLSVDNWKGLDVEGNYTVSCTYHSTDTNQDEGLWYGTIRSGTIQFKMRARLGYLLPRLPGLGLVRFPKSLAHLLAGPGHFIMEAKRAHRLCRSGGGRLEGRLAHAGRGTVSPGSHGPLPFPRPRTRLRSAA